MTPEQKFNLAAWIAALRSGEYQQTHRALRSSGGFCCLGVACEVAGLLRVKSEPGAYMLGEERVAGLVPREWLLKTYGIGEPRVLSNMNDCGSTFAEIADYLEREYGGR